MEDHKYEGKQNPDSVLIGDKNDIVKSIAWFCNKEEMSDIVLKLGEQRFYAHKFVLVLMSDVFRTMCSERWVHDTVNELALNESEQCTPVFPMFLHFLYHGTVYVDTVTALPLLMLADKYNVQPLKCSCEKYIQTQVKQGNIGGAIRWLPYLQLCGHSELEKDCIDVITIEMESVLMENDFLLLNIDLLVPLLQRDDIVVSCEYQLYEGVIKWINAHDNTDSDGNTYLQSLIPPIRFSMMFPDQLLAIEGSDFYQKHTASISPYLALAHRYRSLASEIVDDSFATAIYRPRNYTHGTWCQYLNLDADNASFFGKQLRLATSSELLTSSAPAQDSNWQVQILNERQNEHSARGSGMKLMQAVQGPWRLGSPGATLPIPGSPSSASVSLQMSVRPNKPIRAGTAIDMSLFMVKKDTIVKHLDTKTLFAREHAFQARHSTAARCARESPQASQALQMTREKMFHPSPMHFAFTQVYPSKEPDVVLRHKFTRRDFDHPAEVPCVTFGPHYANPPRPYQSVRIAIITKPRLKSRAELESDHMAPREGAREQEGQDPEVLEDIYENPDADDLLPILG